MDIHDMGARSEAGSKHLFVIVDRTSKFLFAYPPPNKTAENVAKKLLELLLNYGYHCFYGATQARSSSQKLSNTSANGSTRRSTWPYGPPKSSGGCGEAGGVDP